ncbi:MAG: glycosyltransferase family 4 protein [Myxococcota bacterium]
MSAGPIRIAYVTSHPIQYQAPLFRRLAATDGVALKVFFASDMGLSTYVDPGFAREVKWDVPLIEGYEHEFVKNVSPKPGVQRFFGLLNPAMPMRVLAWKPDAVIVHGYAHATEHLVMAACRAAGVPVLLRGESNLLAQRPRFTRLAKLLGAAALKQVLSGALAIGTLSREYFRHYGIPEERIFVAPYSVDNDFFFARADAAEARAAAWKAELGIPAEALVVGFAAKLSAVKDCKTLIEAFGRAAVPGSALAIVGDGPLRQELESQAATYPGSCIKFAGFVNQSEMPAAYALADLFALPSVFEPWGLAINEAMTLGRAVVVSDAVGCAPDLVSRDTGFVFPAGDAQSLAAILTSALGDRERLRRMGAAGREKIRGWGIPETAAGIVSAARAVARA